MLCKKCGAQIPDSSVFCPDCGAKVAAEITQKEESSVDKITQSEESAIDESTQNEQPTQDSLISEESLSEHEQEQVKEQPKKKKNKKLMIGISAAAILLIFGVAIVSHPVSKGSSSEAANNQTTTEQTEKDTDTETETTNTNEYGHETYSDDVAEARLAELDENTNLPISQQLRNFNAIAEDLTDDQLVNYLEIKSDGYLSEDELGNLFVDRMNKWMNAGAYDDLGDLSVDVNESWDEYLPKVAEKNSQFYVEALTDSTSEFSDVKSLNDFTARMTKANGIVLDYYTSTAWNSKDHPENIQPFSDWLELKSVELVNGGGEGDYMEIKVVTVEESNGGIENNKPASDEPIATWYIKAVRSDDGSYKFVAVNYSSQQ